MRTIAAVSTPTGPRIEKIDLLDLGAHDVLLRIIAPNVGAADAPAPHLPRPDDLPPTGPPPDFGGAPLSAMPVHQVNGHGGVAVTGCGTVGLSHVQAARVSTRVCSGG